MLKYALCAVFVGVVAFLLRKPRRKYPPGPPGLPLIGNLFDLPKESSWLAYEAWGQAYETDIVHLNALGTHIFVLNSTEAAKELLEKRASAYSDRPYSVMMHELTGWGRSIALMVYGNEWRAHRRMFHQQFNQSVLPEYHPVMRKEVHALLRMLAEFPAGFAQHIRFMAGAVTLKIIYDTNVQGKDDPTVAAAEKAVHILTLMIDTGSYLVDLLPPLKYLPAWFPGAKFKRDAAAWKPLVDQVFYGFYKQLKGDIDAGQVRPSVVSKILKNINPEEYSQDVEDTIVNTTGTAYAAGVDTTVATLNTFMLAMLLYPEAQKTAQQELDRVLGQERLPELEDRDSLPYTVALAKGVSRWHPPLPMTLMHKSTADDVYNGLDIPAGSLVIGNAWTILHDEKRYPNAHNFDPSRFLTEDGQLYRNVPDPVEAFGFGRRICPGRHFADQFAWLAMVNMLAVFVIEKARDVHNNVVEVKEEFTTAALSVPKPFKASLRQRFEGASNLIQSPDSNGY